MPYSIIVAAFHCVPFSITNICLWGGLQYYYFLFYFDAFLLQIAWFNEDVYVICNVAFFF